MEIKVSNIDTNYAVTTYSSVEFTIPGRKGNFVVTVVEMYNPNNDHTCYDLTCAEGDLTDDELLELKPIFVEIVEKEKEK